LLSVERAESKKQSASDTYHIENKTLSFTAILARVFARTIILKLNFFILRRVELFCLVALSATR
jgi:hypothetical protein